MGNLWFGSKQWANEVLKIAIEDCYSQDREAGSRRLVVFWALKNLESYGFKWQADRLRNHIHLAIKKGCFSFTASAEADSLVSEEASLCR